MITDAGNISPSHSVPSVSVVMPVYNTERYVADAIDSILKQTFSDFEFIIVDDGSTDHTRDIIQSYQDKRIILIQNQTNIGNYPSRNRGMHMAKGKYIAVMDGDDIALPERLQKQYNCLENDTELIAVGSDYIFLPEEKKGVVPLTYEDTVFSLLTGLILLHPSFMVKTSSFQTLNGYNDAYIYASDYDFICRLALAGKIKNLPDRLMIYRKHPAQISHSQKKKQEEYAGNIRRNFQVEFINKFKNASQEKVGFAEVGIPEIGMAICYYTYSTVDSKREKYKELGDKTIDVLYKIITKDMPVCIDNGICGLGCGIHYLIKNNFLDGDVDEILEDIDEKVMQALQKEPEHPYKADILFYMHYRISKAQNADHPQIRTFTSIYNSFNKNKSHEI